MLAKVVEWRRLRAVSVVAGMVFVCLAMIDLAAASMARGFGLPVVDARNMDAQAMARIRARVVALARSKALSADNAAPKFGVLLGGSSIWAGVDAGLLAAEAETDYPWVNFAEIGGRATLLGYYARPLLQSHLKPEVTIVGIHSFMFSHRWEPIQAETGESPRYLLGLGPMWLYANRHHLRAWIGDGTAQSRYLLWRGYGGQFEDFYAPAVAPWVESLWDMSTASPEAWETLWINHEIRGAFEVDNYASGNPWQIRSLLRLVDRLQERGSRVIVVLMPEHSAYRAAKPPTAEALMEMITGRLPPGTTVLDYQASIPDSELRDYTHVNNLGRQRLTRLLAEAVDETRLGSHIPE